MTIKAPDGQEDWKKRLNQVYPWNVKGLKISDAKAQARKELIETMILGFSWAQEYSLENISCLIESELEKAKLEVYDEFIETLALTGVDGMKEVAMHLKDKFLTKQP